ETKRNPLAGARSLYRIENQHLTGDDEYTRRYPSQLRRGIPQLASWVHGYYDEPDYATFNVDFDGGAHGAVHVWVGGRDASSPLPRRAGDMSSVVSAAYDPIFWLHHCMVDRVWFRWQRLHGNSTVPDPVRQSTTYGGFTGEQVLDAEGFLRYIYSDAPVAAYAADAQVETGDEEAPLPPTLTIALGRPASEIRQARLHLEGMRPPRQSYEVRVFLGADRADASTPIDDNPLYAGTLCFFGHGECTGAPGHCNPKLAARGPYDRRPEHPLKTRNYHLDITTAVKAWGTSTDTDSLRLSFVVLDAAGDQVAPEELDFESITVTAD
ncbi:MAG: tyrosinase family protein, partial [Acidobacteriota bacterium]